MNDDLLLGRIIIDPAVIVGKPVIKGTRLTVEFILNLLAHGQTSQEIIDEYDGLTIQDIQASMLFASKFLEDASFMPLTRKVA
jgi:uncharacterized protein (DUF433 family)